MTLAVDAFARTLGFPLDPFQREACEEIADERSVLVAAPTGAGKTAVAEFAMFHTMEAPSGRVFYTTPMKALSNQKYRELQQRYGADSVGLLTGDVAINGEARLVVMTTEVLRNMLYEGRDLGDLEFVVLDEVHFLADRFRGPVWEEVIIHLPKHVRLVLLSATVSNAEEFGDWVDAVRGNTSVIVSETRPVPLDSHVLVGRRLVELFESSKAERQNRPSRELVDIVAGQGHPEARGRRSGRNNKRWRRDARPRRTRRVHRPETVELLGQERLLPAIWFIFSRAGCEDAVRQLVNHDVRLTTAEERAVIRAIVDERTAALPDEDLAVLGYWEWRESLERGVAAHHAGLLPVFKEVVEVLFQRRLVKVVFATETLALGINMPARSVVLEQLEKFNGQTRVRITPGEYTQLTGRAGRRGIDTDGHAVVAWTGESTPEEIASLASRRTYPLQSAFKPTYNMAVNLIDRLGVAGTREVLETSFAQFQADRSVVSLAAGVQEQRASLAAYEESMHCDFGDFAEYAELRRALSDLEKQGSRRGLSHDVHQRIQGELHEVRRAMKAHPCHHCPERERHARWGERYWKLRRQIEKNERQIRRRTGQIAERFERISEILLGLGYVEEHEGETRITRDGDRLRRIYGERDLLVAESIRQGIWAGLDAPGLAALVSTLVFEGRRDDGMLPERYLPKGQFLDALHRTQDLWAHLDELERDHRLPGSIEPQTGIAQAIHRWARGYPLDSVLDDIELAAGDFVRWVKQTIDLLDQLSLVAPQSLARTARDASDALYRGVVTDLGAAA
ncbi:DEAD/DEAH box helicase [uncultured Agrococcus sp.]|uniref:DEAD/DEAH box helicase n=1 Tax=uncultured Agrococcus sp. TaxID=382258 RepID=UPI0025F34269|nr:DEAD/DEAH box helicase [uncultured Agrococcus sp.]